MDKLIYLASPYGHDKPAKLRQQRYEAALVVEAAMMRDGLMVYSPIAHRHPGAVRELYPLGWEYWKSFDSLIITRCDEVHVLRLTGWESSIGVKAEIDLAKCLDKRVVYILYSYFEPILRTL